MTNPRNDQPVRENSPAAGIEADPSFFGMNGNNDWRETREEKSLRRLNEFIVMTGPSEASYTSGFNIALDHMIGSEQALYRGAVENFHDEQARGLWKPTEVFADMIEADGASYADLAIWGPRGRLLAVLVPRHDETGYQVTRFSPDRAHPGPIISALKDQATAGPVPVKAWRSFKVGEGPGYVTVIDGDGTTLDDAIAEAVREIRMLVANKVEPSDLVIAEQGRIVCRVLAKDVVSGLTWDELDEQNTAIAWTARLGAADATASRGVHTMDTPDPKPFSPADLPEPILALARTELRDAIDALLGARHRVNEAHNGMGILSGDQLRLVKAIDQRADNICTESEYAIAKSLLSLWGIDDGEVHPAGTTPAPWTPCGALIENRNFAWVVPGEMHGRPDYRIVSARIRLIDGENLEDEEMSDDDWDRLLERPPCRYLTLGDLKTGEVIDPECHEWH